MHYSSFITIKKFVEKYLDINKNLKILDFGSYDYNGTCKTLFSWNSRWEYIGCDIDDGPNVDLVIDRDATNLFENSYDIIVCNSCFEHNDFFWETYIKFCQILKPGGFICLVVPSTGPYHGFPTDSWRFLKDSYLSLEKWGLKKQYNVRLIENFIDSSNDRWNDNVGIYTKYVNFEQTKTFNLSNNYIIDNKLVNNYIKFLYNRSLNLHSEKSFEKYILLNKIIIIVSACLYGNSDLYEERKKNYISGITKLKQQMEGYAEIFIVENNCQDNRSFLDDLGLPVIYSKNNYINSKNIGQKWLTDMKYCIELHSIPDDVFVCHMTGRYLLESESEFIQNLKKDITNVDAIVRFGSYYPNASTHRQKDCVTGLFGMRCKYFRELPDKFEGCVEWIVAEKILNNVEEKKCTPLKKLGIQIAPGGYDNYYSI